MILLINVKYNIILSIIDAGGILWSLCSQNAISAADDLSEYMEQFCHVRKERFIMHPGSQFNIARVMGAAYILSLPLLTLGGVFCFVAAVLCAIAFA